MEDNLTSRILKRIMKLMPDKRNTEEQANIMQVKMDQIIEDEFKKENTKQQEMPYWE